MVISRVDFSLLGSPCVQSKIHLYFNYTREFYFCQIFLSKNLFFISGRTHSPRHRMRVWHTNWGDKGGTEDFWGFVNAGARLAELHVTYESQPEYDQLKLVQNPDVPLNWRVEKMKLSKDKTSLVYNDFLTIDNIPAKAFDYRLGTRSALEWVINQYCVKTDKRSGIVNDPNRADDPEYIVRLIGQVISVSLETVDIVGGLPGLE